LQFTILSVIIINVPNMTVKIMVITQKALQIVVGR